MQRFNPMLGIFSPEDLSLLKGLFDEACISNETPPESEAASRLATALIAAFESGVRDRDRLWEMMTNEQGRKQA